MKAILVIDIDDCINVEPCKADVYMRFPFQSNGWVREYKNVSLKPMSTHLSDVEEVIKTSEIIDRFGRTDSEDFHSFENGFKACLEEIEK